MSDVTCECCGRSGHAFRDCPEQAAEITRGQVAALRGAVPALLAFLRRPEFGLSPSQAEALDRFEGGNVHQASYARGAEHVLALLVEAPGELALHLESGGSRDREAAARLIRGLLLRKVG